MTKATKEFETNLFRRITACRAHLVKALAFALDYLFRKYRITKAQHISVVGGQVKSAGREVKGDHEERARGKRHNYTLWLAISII